MKIYAELTLGEMEAVARMPPTKEEVVTTLFSEEGVFEARGKLFKVGVLDAPAYEAECGGRRFHVDPSTSTTKEAWQIPVPNTAEHKTVLTHHLAEGLALVVEKRVFGATYFFTGGTVAQAANWLQLLKK
jgi:hypothetical protein